MNEQTIKKQLESLMRQREEFKNQSLHKLGVFDGGIAVLKALLAKESTPDESKVEAS